MDAITLLKQDHKTVKGLFRQFEKAGDDAHTTKRQLADEIVKELSVHAAVEEAVFYPAVKGISDDLKDHVLESLEEHHVVKWLCSEIEDLEPEHERFDAKVTVLIENVRHHIEEEETEFFPQVREALDRKTLGEIGELLEKAKEIAPTRPHPRAPDEPPMNAVTGLVAGLIDRAREAGKKAMSKSAKRAKTSAKRAATGPKRATGNGAKRTKKAVASRR
jgi:hemerythrin superfamily protein